MAWAPLDVRGRPVAAPGCAHQRIITPHRATEPQQPLGAAPQTRVGRTSRPLWVGIVRQRNEHRCKQMKSTHRLQRSLRWPEEPSHASESIVRQRPGVEIAKPFLGKGRAPPSSPSSIVQAASVATPFEHSIFPGIGRRHRTCLCVACCHRAGYLTSVSGEGRMRKLEEEDAEVGEVDQDQDSHEDDEDRSACSALLRCRCRLRHR